MDMYKSKALVKEEHNMPGYFVPQIPFDPIRHKDAKEQYQFNIGKKKRPNTAKLDMKTDKACIYKIVKKHSQGVPAPWSYENSKNLKWLRHP